MTGKSIKNILSKYSFSLLNYSLVLMIVMLTGCINENPELVNPQPIRNSVHVRFINLSGDFEKRAIEYNKTTKSTAIDFSTTTKAEMPAADSVFAVILKNDAEDYAAKSRIKFYRNTIYSLVALPKQDSATNYRPVDSIIVLSSVVGMSQKLISAWVQVINAVPDTNATYSITIGCQNGTAIASGVGYRSQSGITEVRSGSMTVTLIKNKYGLQEPLDLYHINLTTNGQYGLIVTRNSLGNEELKLLDHFDTTVNALKSIEKVSERQTFIRAINLSSSSVDVVKEPGDIIATSLPSGQIGAYASLTACTSTLSDTLATVISSTTSSRCGISLDVSQRYTVFSFDSVNSGSTATVAVKPVQIDEALAGRAIIRVIHGDPNSP